MKILKKVLYVFFLTVFILIFIFCSIYLVNYLKESKKSEATVDELKQEIAEEDEEEYNEVTPEGEKTGYVDFDGVLVQKKYAKLYKKNQDFVGWIKIEDTEIDYPVVQSIYEEEYYLYRDFYKESSSAGTIFIDGSSDVKNGDNIILYGHNMQTGKMFHDLLKYEDEDFYKEHKYISFNTIYGDETYEVIGAFRTKIYEADKQGFKYYQFFEAETESEYMDYVRNCNSLTPYQIEMTAKYGDKLLTLSTCAYHTKNGRYVVVAREVTEENKID